MYSIIVAVKDSNSIEFLIGSAMSLSFIYRPASLLGLDIISSIGEEKYIDNIRDINGFKKEIYQLYLFWKNPDNKINNLRPIEVFVTELEGFCMEVIETSSDLIEYITLF